MSFGYGVVDAITLIQLAWRTFEGAKRACGEHHEMTKEVESLHTVLEHLRTEIQSPDSLINKAEDRRRIEIRNHMAGCEKYLRGIDSILRKYNSLSDTERSEKKFTRFWQKVRFANGEVAYLADMRVKIVTYNTAILMSLHLLSHGSQSRVERQMGDLAGSVNLVVAKLNSRIQEGSSMTTYSNDDRLVWRALRRELIRDGCPSAVIHEHKTLIQDYIKELGFKGVLDSPNCSRLSLKSYIGIGQTLEQSSPLENNQPDPESFRKPGFEKEASILEGLTTSGEETTIEHPDNTEGAPRDIAQNTSQNVPGCFNDGEIAEERRARSLSMLAVDAQSTNVALPSVSGQTDQSVTTILSNLNETIPPSSSSSSSQAETGETQDSDKSAQVVLAQDDANAPSSYSSSRALTKLGDDVPSAINEMMERLAFLERLTLLQQDRLGGVGSVTTEHNGIAPERPDQLFLYQQRAAEIKAAQVEKVAEIKADTERKIAEIKGRMIPVALKEWSPEQERVAEIKTTVVRHVPKEVSLEQEKAKNIKDAQIRRVAEIKADADQKIAEIKAATMGSPGSPLSPLSYSLIPDEIKNMKPVKFKDAVGRKFSFPFYLARTWPGMEELVRQAFLHVDEFREHVQNGHYDLVADGEIVLPGTWEGMVRPDLNVVMMMWPVPQKPPGPPTWRSTSRHVRSRGKNKSSWRI